MNPPLESPPSKSVDFVVKSVYFRAVEKLCAFGFFVVKMFSVKL